MKERYLLKCANDGLESNTKKLRKFNLNTIPYLLFIWLLISFPLRFGFGQHYNFKTFTAEEGLELSDINTIYQDKKGYLWVGTYGGGVSRFDGVKFTNYLTKNGLSDNSVFWIIEDRQGNFWFGTFTGLTKYDGINFTVYTKKHGLKDDFIRKIMEDRKGNLWLSTNSGGASRFNGIEFTNFTTANGLINNEVRTIIEDRENNLWFATAQGVSKYDGGTFTSDIVTQRLKGYFVHTILEDQSGSLWFGTDKNGALCFDGKTFTVYTTKQGLCGNNVFDIMEDSSGNFWFSTLTGASKFDGEVFTNYTTREGLRHNSVRRILEDREGNFWFATDSGVSRFREEKFTYFNEKDGLKNSIVWSIWGDDKGIMWFATEGGIMKYDREKAGITLAEGIYSKEIAYPFYEDRKGNLWFGTGTAIIKYDGRKYTNFSKKNNMDPVEIFSILEDSHGNMWFGTSRSGLKMWDGETIKTFTKQDGLLDNRINTLAEDKQGNIWMGTEQGFSRYNGVNFTHVTTDHGLSNKSVLSILVDRENNLWIGTFGGGVSRYRPHQTNENATVENFTTFRTEDGLREDEIVSLLFDDHGNLWIASKRAISVLDIAEFNKTGKKKIKTYTKPAGFLGIEPTQNAIYKDKEGNIWFGTINGVIKLNPIMDKPNMTAPAVYITGLKLFLEEVDWSARWNKHQLQNGFALPGHLELPHTQNHLTFEYIGISLTAPEEVRYRIKLEGFDQQWSPVSKTTHATYSNLPPGQYAFKVKACNNSGLWVKEPAVYRFAIKPPFWQRWWFFMICFVAAIGSIYGVIVMRTRKLKKQKQALEDQVLLSTIELRKEKARVEQVNLELEERVEERTRKLEAALKQLLHAQKMEAIGTLAGGVAHDLNNILAGIVSYPELMLMELPQDSPLKNYALTIQRSGEKAAAIVQDLLTLARRGIAIRETVNINQVVSEFKHSPECERILSYNPNVQIEYHADEHLHYIMGSPVHLSKTIMNLISNAAEAMPEGGKIIITTKNQCIAQPGHGNNELTPGDYVVLTVSDNGIGISQKDMERIFEPFYTKKKMGKSGTGLGMAVVWGTVKDHHGHITVQSEESKGTSFTLYFPAALHKMPQGESKALLKELMGNGEAILVVDDVEEQREAACLMLKRLGYLVEAVSSGEAAVDYVKDHPVDLLVLDMIMDPGINGVETYKRIIQLHSGQKAIIVSGYSETAEVKEAQELGAGAYLKKPFGIKQIGKAVKNELNK